MSFIVACMLILAWSLYYDAFISSESVSKDNK